MNKVNDGAIILNEAEQSALDMLIAQYNSASDTFSVADTQKKALGSALKSMLADYNITKYVSSDGTSVSMSVKPNVSYDEEVLIKVIENLGVPGIVKTKKYVDMTELESALYHRVISTDDIKAGVIVKPDTVTLRCTKKKQLNE